MIYDELAKDWIIKDWLDSTTHKENTRRLYLFSMQYYTEFLKMTPEELLLEAEADIRNGVLPRLWKLKRHLLDYKEHLRVQGLAPLTIKTRMTGVYSFYKKNDISLPSLPKNEAKPRPLKQHKDIPTKEDIQKVLNHSDELEKAIILIGVSSGLAVSEICNLRVKDFKNGYDPVTGVTTLKLRREKAEYDFVTFLTPEASNAVLNYLDIRNKVPKTTVTERKRHVLAKQKIYNDSNYLLIGRKIPFEYLKTRNEELRKLQEEAIISLYQNLAEAANKITPLGTWSLIRSHNMRKYFNSTLLNNGADNLIVNFWMGHTLDDTQSAYFRASAENGLKETYMKFIPYLTIEKALDISESPEYQKIKQENQVLQAETARHIVERHELKAVWDELGAIKQAAADKENMRDLQLRVFKSQLVDQPTLTSTELKMHNDKMKTDKSYRNDYIDFIESQVYEKLEAIGDKGVNEPELKEAHERHTNKELNQLRKSQKTLFDKLL